MSRRVRRVLTFALLGALPILTVACPFGFGIIFLKLDVKNDTFYTLSEFNLSSTTSTDWGDSQLEDKVEPGNKATIRGIAPGDYDYRARFWTKDSGIIDVLNNGAFPADPLSFTTLNICLTYSQYFSGDPISQTREDVL